MVWVPAVYPVVLRVSEDKKTLTLPDGTVLTEGDYVSLNGSTGEVFAQKIKTVPAAISGDFETFMAWADKERKLFLQALQETTAE